MPREKCEQCYYPRSTCVCAAVLPVNNRLNIHILQHPKEAKAAKNTARLLALCMPRVTIYTGETALDFDVLKQTLEARKSNKSWVVYPSEQSQCLTKKKIALGEEAVENLVFIDATWRKAYKMWQLSPWLKRYRAIQLNAAELGMSPDYQIRQTQKPQAYSTLESVVMTLKVLEPHCDTAPLMALFHKMQSSFLLSRSI